MLFDFIEKRNNNGTGSNRKRGKIEKTYKKGDKNKKANELASN
jgi:hypothetical protein